jgi:hypothetical protein
MISTIHVLKARAGLDEDTYRDFLESRTGKRSARDLSVREAGRIIDDLRGVAGEGGPRGAVAGLDGPIGSKLRALWIAGYNLGIVRDRTDRAMLSFLERQTGVSHVRFLKEVHAGSSAIQGLKAWLKREGGIDWPSDRFDVIANKRAILNAQWRRLIELGEIKQISAVVDRMEDLQFYAARIVRQNRPFETMQSRDYDEVQKALGNKLRGALARRYQSTNQEN